MGILPASETALPTSYPIGAGDRMSASIYETSSTVTSGFFFRRTTEHVWDITISDTTRGWSYTTKQAYNGPGTSAEWVVEAPEVGNKIATLAHYTMTPPSGTGDFDHAGVLSTVVATGTPAYAGANLNYQNDSGVMIQNGAQVSTPGDPDVPLTAFNAAYGSALPATSAGEARLSRPNRKRPARTRSRAPRRRHPSGLKVGVQSDSPSGNDPHVPEPS